MLEPDETPCSDFMFLPSDSQSDSEPNPDLAAFHKFASSSSSSSEESDSEPNLGGFEQPEFDFTSFSLNMFSLSKPQNIEKQIAAIDLQLSEMPPYQYQLRASLKEDKKNLLKQLEQEKGKGKARTVSLAVYNPVELYQRYPEGHDDKQRFRIDKEAML